MASQMASQMGEPTQLPRPPRSMRSGGSGASASSRTSSASSEVLDEIVRTFGPGHSSPEALREGGKAGGAHGGAGARQRSVHAPGSFAANEHEG